MYYISLLYFETIPIYRYNPLTRYDLNEETLQYNIRLTSSTTVFFFPVAINWHERK